VRSRKTKAFFWDKVPDARLPGSLWEGMAAADWLDWPALEEAFAQAVRTKTASRAATAPKQARSTRASCAHSIIFSIRF
jgi:hypothetical protein